MRPDSGAFLDIIEGRISAMRGVPWVIPALILIEMTDEDLDLLDAAADTPGYWPLLMRVIERIIHERKEH